MNAKQRDEMNDWKQKNPNDKLHCCHCSLYKRFAVRTVKACEGIEVWFHSFLTLARDWVTDQLRGSAALPPVPIE